ERALRVLVVPRGGDVAADRREIDLVAVLGVVRQALGRTARPRVAIEPLQVDLGIAVALVVPGDGDLVGVHGEADLVGADAARADLCRPRDGAGGEKRGGENRGWTAAPTGGARHWRAAWRQRQAPSTASSPRPSHKRPRSRPGAVTVSRAAASFGRSRSTAWSM